LQEKLILKEVQEEQERYPAILVAVEEAVEEAEERVFFTQPEVIL